MRVTVVPAQITTVEDKIAGNLTFVQIILLIVALLVGAGLYTGLPPHLHLGSVKLALICLQLFVFAGLAFRIRGKIVADWLVLYLRFSVRPRIYVFTKNDVTARDIVLLEPEKVVKTIQPVHAPLIAMPTLSLPEKDQLEQLLENPSLTVRLALAKKGGIDVSLTPIKR